MCVSKGRVLSKPLYVFVFKAAEQECKYTFVFIPKVAILTPKEVACFHEVMYSNKQQLC